MGFIAPYPLTVAGRVKDVVLAGNAYSAPKDIAALSRERAWWVSGSFALKSELASASETCGQPTDFSHTDNYRVDARRSARDAEFAREPREHPTADERLKCGMPR